MDSLRCFKPTVSIATADQGISDGLRFDYHGGGVLFALSAVTKSCDAQAKSDQGFPYRIGLVECPE